MALALALYAIGGMFIFYAIEVPYERQVFFSYSIDKNTTNRLSMPKLKLT